MYAYGGVYTYNPCTVEDSSKDRQKVFSLSILSTVFKTVENTTKWAVD